MTFPSTPPEQAQTTALLEGATIPPMQRRLWVLMPLGGLSISLVWGAVLQVLILRQVASFPGGQDEGAAGIAGAVLTVGAVVAVFSQPLAGWLSDRTRIAFLGRRNVWILGGGIVGLFGLVATALAPSAWALSLLWALTMLPLGAYQAATSTLLAERVPVDSRGRMSAICGTAGMIGAGGGAVIASLISDIFVAYLVFAIQLVVVAAMIGLFTRDILSAAIVSQKSHEKRPFPGPRTAPDFWWAFLGRFLTFTAFSLASGLQLFVLRDHIKVGDGSTEAATAAVGQVAGVGLLFLVLGAMVAGFLADKVGRMKPFVIAASLLFVPAAVLLLVWPTFSSALIAFSLMSLGLGSYVSVDQALITRVLPTLDDAGRDLGILNVANSGPQVIAPVLGGALIASIGYPALFIVVAVLALIGALVVLRIRSVR